MSTEAKGHEDIIDENDLFDFSNDEFGNEEEQDHQDFLDDLDGDEFGDPNEPEDVDEEQEEQEEDEEESDGDLFYDQEDEEEDEDGFTDKDLADFNKKLSKDFKTTQELKDFLNKDEVKAEDPEKEETEYKKSQEVIGFYTEILNKSDEDLMREEYKAIALNRNQDINTEEVQDEIEDKIQELRDLNQLDIRADKLRDQIKSNVLNPAVAKKNEIDARREQEKQSQIKSETEKVQNALVKIHNSESFFGVKPDRKVINKIYKEVSSGRFLEKLQGDKAAAAELAMMLEYRDEIYKKSSGLTYSDGMKAVLDEFETRKKQNAESPMARAQRRGTAGAGDSTKGLIAGLIK